jgi:hypothetical protein
MHYSYTMNMDYECLTLPLSTIFPLHGGLYIVGTHQNISMQQTIDFFHVTDTLHYIDLPANIEYT